MRPATSLLSSTRGQVQSTSLPGAGRPPFATSAVPEGAATTARSCAAPWRRCCPGASTALAQPAPAAPHEPVQRGAPSPRREGRATRARRTALATRVVSVVLAVARVRAARKQAAGAPCGPPPGPRCGPPLTALGGGPAGTCFAALRARQVATEARRTSTRPARSPHGGAACGRAPQPAPRARGPPIVAAVATAAAGSAKCCRPAQRHQRARCDRGGRPAGSAASRGAWRPPKQPRTCRRAHAHRNSACAVISVVEIVGPGINGRAFKARWRAPRARWRAVLASRGRPGTRVDRPDAAGPRWSPRAALSGRAARHAHLGKCSMAEN